MHIAGLGVVPPAIALGAIPTFSMATPLSTSAVMASATATGLTTPTTLTLYTPASQRALPLPPKLVKRILDLEFIDMAELVPDSWRYQEEESNKCCHQSKRQQRGPVSDILLWVECYASLVEILCTGYPDKTPGFMAYQRTIVRAQRSFLGEGWVTYDTCYRRQAAVTRALDWGQVDFTLYNETFTGRAKAISRCKFCSSEHHSSNECMFAPETPKQSPAPKQGYSRYDRHESSHPSSSFACHLYNSRNGNRCRFSPCKFTHSCAECQGSHPASQCRSRPPPSKFSRMESRAESPGKSGRK